MSDTYVHKMAHLMTPEEREAYEAHVREEARKCGISDSPETNAYLLDYYEQKNVYSGD
jgi:hypothetical protein